MQERLHTRDMDLMGGLWDKVPRMAVVGMIFAMASLGLPGLGNFIAEILVLLGAFQADQVITIIATLGLIAATVYALRFVQQVFHGKARRKWRLEDFNKRELGIAGAMIIVIVWLGLYPQPLINTAAPALEHIRSHLTAPDILPRIRNMDDHAGNLYLSPAADATAEQNLMTKDDSQSEIFGKPYYSGGN